MFPTAVLTVKEFLSKSECELICNVYRKDKLSEHKLLEGSGSSNYSPYEAELDFLENTCKIKEKLQFHIDDYCAKLGLYSVSLANSWINVQNPGSFLEEHLHASSAISGALYLRTDDESSGLQFRNPNPFLDFFQIKNRNQYNFDVISFQPKSGDLIIFPSWLKHGGSDVNHSRERIVLSFNTRWVG